MRILALETATAAASAAIWDETGPVAESFFYLPRAHSQQVMPIIDNMLRISGVTLLDLDGYAVSIGPGSFTGLRIGMATIKGLAQVSGKPLVGVCTLDALAENMIGHDGLICPILDARKNEVYTAVYRSRNWKMERLTDYLALSPGELPGLFSSSSAKVIFLGDVLPLYQEGLREVLGERAVFPRGDMIMPRAAKVGYLALPRLKSGRSDNLHTLKPFYLRPSQAEVVLQQSRKKLE